MGVFADGYNFGTGPEAFYGLLSNGRKKCCGF